MYLQLGQYVPYQQVLTTMYSIHTVLYKKRVPTVQHSYTYQQVLTTAKTSRSRRRVETRPNKKTKKNGYCNVMIPCRTVSSDFFYGPWIFKIISSRPNVQYYEFILFFLLYHMVVSIMYVGRDEIIPSWRYIEKKNLYEKKKK